MPMTGFIFAVVKKIVVEKIDDHDDYPLREAITTISMFILRGKTVFFARDVYQ